MVFIPDPPIDFFYSSRIVGFSASTLAPAPATLIKKSATYPHA